MATQANLDYVQKMFVAYLGRAASASAQEYYADLIDADAELGKAQLFDDLYNSAEGQALYGGMTNDQVIDQIFQNCFNRDPAFAGQTYYYNAIADGTFNILEAAAVIANDASADDAAILSAKQTAADKVTTEMGSDADAIANYSGNAAEARESLNKVTDSASAASYDAAAELAAISTGNQIGETTALTTATDQVVGTDANDTITGTNATYNAADLILDGTTTDSDTLTVNATADITATPTVSGIENVNVVMDSFDGGGDNEIDFDAAGITGGTITGSVTTLGTSVNKLSVTNASTGTTIVGGTGITTAITVTGDDNAALTITGAVPTITATAAAGALTNVTATSSSATAVTVSAADADGTVKATTTGANLTVSAAAAKTIDANSAKDLTLTTVGATKVTAVAGGSIDADTTALTAATTIDLTAGDEIKLKTTAATSATISAEGVGAAGGSPVSTVTDTAGVLTTLTVSGNGAPLSVNTTAANALKSVIVNGDQNVTVVMDASDIDALTGNKLTLTDNGSGTSTLSVGTAAGDMDLSAATPDVISLAIDNNAKSMTVASGQAVTIAVDQTATTIDGVDAGAASNTVSITLSDGATAGQPDIATSLTLTDFATATIEAPEASTITALTASADNTSVTINGGTTGVTLAGTHTTGTGTLTITGSGAVALGASVITAKSITTSGTGAVTWTAADASKVASVTTDGGADAITVSGTNGNLTVSTGGGNDTVTVGANTTAAKSLTVNLGDGTGDTLKITTGVNLTTATSTFSASGHEILDLQGTLTLPNSLVNGSTAVVTDSAAAVLAATIVMGTDTTTDLSGLVINTSKLTAGADGFVIGNAASTASLTLKATSLGDTLNGGTVADTLTGGSGGDTITALAGNDTIVGGAGADTINAGTGNDHVTAGEGADGVIVGAGADTVVLTETTSAADNVQFAALTDGSAAGVAGKNFSGYNVITGFKTTVDDLVFDGGVANIDDTVDTDILNGSIIVKAGTVATTALNDITADNFTSVDQVVNFLNDAGVGFTATASQNEVFFVTIGTGASAFTAVYAFVNNADTTVDATELYLIATVDATLVAGDGIG